MTLDALKREAAHAALRFVRDGDVIGIGTGSTVDAFVEALAKNRLRIRGAVATSERTARGLEAAGIPCIELNTVDTLSIYIDSADEIDGSFSMIKGGGGALTREKIVAAVASRFVCIADASKKVDVLGRFPLPIEVIPQARAYVTRVVSRLGGNARLRHGFVTDNGNQILDIHGLTMTDPIAFEGTLDHVAGTVTNGLFARRGADVLLLGTTDGVVEVHRP